MTVGRFVSNAAAPQFIDPLRLAGYALIFGAAIASGQSHATEYRFGLHAAATYESNTVRAVYPPVKGGHIPTPVGPWRGNNQAPQLLDLTLPASVFPPVKGGARPQPPPLITNAAAPQLADFTQQASLTRPLVGILPFPVQKTHASPQLADLTQQASFFHTQAQLGRVPPYLIGQPPQQDFTLPAIVTPIASPHPGASAPFIGQISAAPQADTSQIQPLVWPAQPRAPSTAPSAQYEWGTHAANIYEANTVRQVFPSVRTPPPGPPPQAVKWFATDPRPDLTQQGWIGGIPLASGWLQTIVLGEPQDDPSVVQGVVFTPLIRAIATPFQPIQIITAAPELRDLTQQALIVPSAVAFQPPAMPLPFITAAPQLLDLTLQAVFTTAQPIVPTLGPTIKPLPTAQGQLIDLTLQGFITPSAIFVQPTFGPTVFPLTVPPQPDTNVNYSSAWTPSVYSPSAPVPPPITVDTNDGLPKKKPQVAVIYPDSQVIRESDLKKIQAKLAGKPANDVGLHIQEVVAPVDDEAVVAAYLKDENERANKLLDILAEVVKRIK